jgi:hypothetical protein
MEAAAAAEAELEAYLEAYRDIAIKTVEATR